MRGVAATEVQTCAHPTSDANGDNAYQVIVHANDGVHDTTQAVTISVTDTNDVAPTITSAATGSEAENTAATNVVYQIIATDTGTAHARTPAPATTDTRPFTFEKTTGARTFQVA